MKYVCIYLVIINIFTFITYGVDKRKAVKNRWRIPERTLLILAAAGGSPGAWLGMRLFRHKTRHPKFNIGVPVIFALQLTAVICGEIYFRWI